MAIRKDVRDDFKQRLNYSLLYKLTKRTNKQHFFFPELPHFITKPSSSVTVKEKQKVTLPCKAAGFPPPVITWYKDGDIIEEERRQFKKRNLEIKEIQFKDRGIYICTAENLLGRVQLSLNVTVKGM